MKKILIPTDFSAVADNALRYGMQVAAKLDFQILLYHVYTFYRKIDYDRRYSEENQPYVQGIRRKMNALRSKHSRELADLGVELVTEIDEDNVYSLFRRKVEEHDVDMIIMGSKGATAMERVLFGSVAAAAVEMSTVPVLIVPPDYGYESMEKVVLAVDHEDIAPEVLAPFGEMMRAFGSSVTIVNVQNGSTQKEDHSLHHHLTGLESQYVQLPQGNSITATMNAFVEANCKHLLCMVRRHRDFFGGLFKRSVTKSQLYNSRVPLLVLPE